MGAFLHTLCGVEAGVEDVELGHDGFGVGARANIADEADEGDVSDSSPFNSLAGVTAQKKCS